MTNNGAFLSIPLWYWYDQSWNKAMNTTRDCGTIGQALGGYCTPTRHRESCGRPSVRRQAAMPSKKASGYYATVIWAIGWTTDFEAVPLRRLVATNDMSRIQVQCFFPSSTLSSKLMIQVHPILIFPYGLCINILLAINWLSMCVCTSMCTRELVPVMKSCNHQCVQYI